MAEFNFFLNRQGIQGRKGEKGDTGFSPTISVGTDTLDEYKLIIANESNTFETPNLRGNINIQDNGGTYLRYDIETKQISAQNMDTATADTVGGVRLSTEADIVEMGAGSVVTPSDVADALPLYLEGEGAVTITQDELTSKTKIKVDIPSVNDLESRMSTAEAEIADIQTNVADLNNNKVSKTDLATTESAGIVKVDGTSITVTGDGTISASPSGALPIASTTQLGGVKVDGTSIIADENGVISSVGGGGTGDVTASGNNVFTGNNEFKKDVTITCANDLSNPSGLTITNAKNPEGYKTTFNVDSENGNFRVKTNKAIELMSQFATYIDGGQSNLSVHNNGITFTSNDVLRYYNNDGSYNYVPLVTQENIKAGENITLNKNAETGDITISSTGGGGTGDIPIATTTTAGKVKPDGTTITITDDGTISAVGGSSGGATIDDSTTTTTSVWSSSKTNTEITTVANEVVQIQGDVASLDGDVSTLKTDVSGLKTDVSGLNTSKQNTLVSGTNIKTINGETILGEGNIAVGGSTPTNMVTTDTDQTINGSKTFANSTGTMFTGTSSNSHSIILDGDDREIKFISQGVSTGTACIKNQGNSATNLNIGDNFNSVKITTTLYDKNGNEIVGGSGSAPDNVVTTDTSQTISGAKTFTEPTVFQNTLDMSTGGTDTLNIYATGSSAEGYTTDIKFHKNLNIKGQLSGGVITLAPYGTGLNALKYKDSSNPSNPSYDILHTGNLVTGNNITISEPNSTGVRTISGPSNEYMAHMAFPSSRYVDLTLGESGSRYTAPADGWLLLKKTANAANQYVQIQIQNKNVVCGDYLMRSVGNSGTVSITAPMSKGSVASMYYNFGGNTNMFRFIYAEGEK